MQRYLETRIITGANATIGSDLARHLLTRQHLGKTVVVCDNPVIVMSVVRKYWLRLTRNVQKERSSTLNAERILQLTHDITHMQHMNFVARSFRESPRGDVYFMLPEQLDYLPANCYTLYVTEDLSKEHMTTAIPQLPNMSLVVDYTRSTAIAKAPLRPKYQLESTIPEHWRRVEQFLDSRGVRIASQGDPTASEDFDAMLDVLLGCSSQFMRVANDFLELLRLAQPLQTSSSDQHRYDVLATLNRRICALTPGTLSQQFIQTLNDPEDEDALHDFSYDRLAALLSM